MLPSDVVRHIATFLPATHAQIVEPVWRPNLSRAFYDDLYDRDTYRHTIHGNSGSYNLETRRRNGQYVTTMYRNGSWTGCVCYHGDRRHSAKDASDWLVRVMYSGHRDDVGTHI